MTGVNTKLTASFGEASIDIAELSKKLGLDKILAASEAAEAERKEKAAKEKAEAAAKAENERMEALVKAATGEQAQKLETALQLVKALSDQAALKNEEMGAAIKEKEAEILAVKEQVSQLLAARDNSGTGFNAQLMKAKYSGEDALEKEVENVVLLSYLMEKGVFETKYGAEHQKAVNGASSIEVSSETYESIFSQRILRDIQAKLIVGAMFEEMPMQAKSLTMLVEPEAGEASWVDASTYGKPETTGVEIKSTLSEITFRTHKLAAKSFMVDETDEDAIMALLPILRRRLIEAHAIAIERSFMNGDGDAKPLGLLRMAEKDGQKHATEAKADGSVKVTAKTIAKLRRNMGRKGLDMSKLVLVISLDAYFDLLEDEEWQDVSQVDSTNSLKLTGQVGRIYGLPIVVSEYFPARAAGAEFAMLVYRDNFVVPRQRSLTVEKERQASRQRDAYYTTQRLNLQRFFDDGVVTGTYAA